MLRLGFICLTIFAALLTQGCCCGPCGVGGGYENGPLAANPGVPACGGCGECIHCRRSGALQAARNLVLCHNGCGDLYYDEWFSDPAAPHDPCDYCYCPSPFRRIWWNLVALHTAPHPGCYAPTCGEACAATGCDDGVDYGDGDYVDDGAYYDAPHGGELPAHQEPSPAAQPSMPPSRPLPPASRTLEKAHRDWNPQLKTSGLKIVPRRTLTAGR